MQNLLKPLVRYLKTKEPICIGCCVGSTVKVGNIPIPGVNFSTPRVRHIYGGPARRRRGVLCLKQFAT